MSFVSLFFYVFFPIVTLSYFLVPQRFRIALLLLASCVFYMSFIPAYILVLFALILVDYTVAIKMETSQGETRRHLLWISISAMVGALFFFKYFNFFNANIAILANWFGLHYPIGMLSIALPLGLSFHTFQSLSYVIEVYRGKQAAERNFWAYALYVMFYPQLVAGPIERPQQFLYQLHAPHFFDYERARLGAIRMLWGFFKKTVVADHLSLAVSQVYGHPNLYPGLSLTTATAFFALQIYFDFSGYCDIALGAAQMMGFELMENFNRPFSSKSMTEWWHRWHISLSSWFRDYFYYPLLLSQKKVTSLRIYGAILLTFLVTGFWHGANWTYGAFGLINGIYIVIGTATQKIRHRIAEKIGILRFPRLHRAYQAFAIFCLVAFATLFFRTQSMSDAWYLTTHLFSDVNHWANMDYVRQTLFANSWFTKAAVAFPLALLVLWCEQWNGEESPFKKLVVQPWWFRWSVYWSLLFAVVFLSTAAGPGFIYFQF